MSLKTCFSTPILQQSIPKARTPLIKELIQEAFQLQKRDHLGVKWSKENYQRGYTSYGSIDQLHRFSSTYEKLESLFQAPLKHFLKASHLSLTTQELFLSKMWVNIMGPGCTHPFHLHPLSVVSGTFYLQMPKSAPGIKFEDPRLPYFMNRPMLANKAPASQKNFLQLKTKAGEIVLFESWLKHEVPSNPGETERISVSFNYDLK